MPGARSNVSQFSLSLRSVTPILGGASQPRTVDDVDVIRAPTVRGHLRFWWRALHSHLFASSRELYACESALFGHAATEQAGGRSPISVRVTVENAARAAELVDTENVTPRTIGAYALWPAREEQRDGKVIRPAAPRRRPNLKFRLTFTISVDAEKQRMLENSIRAWIIFGGYGSRTRRGLGSLTVVEDSAVWLPSAPSREAFRGCFGRDVFEALSPQTTDTPALAGASLHVSTNPCEDPTLAWSRALEPLRDFRQSPNTGARKPGAGPNRPSISNWPEPDKIRRLLGKTKGHPPRKEYNSSPAWPRAGFGLPINGRFQSKDRSGQRIEEPGDFRLRLDCEDSDRLASPLIVKALPLTNDRYVPCALWLNRSHPECGIRLEAKHAGNYVAVPLSNARFDQLIAPGDTPLFPPLEASSLRIAFLSWLHSQYRTTVIAT